MINNKSTVSRANRRRTFLGALVTTVCVVGLPAHAAPAEPTPVVLAEIDVNPVGNVIDDLEDLINDIIDTVTGGKPGEPDPDPENPDD